MEKQTKIAYFFFLLFILSTISTYFVRKFFVSYINIIFLITIIFLCLFLITVFYSIYTLLNKGYPLDLWKLFFLASLAVFGVLGYFNISPYFHSGFIGFFGFFRFFALRKELPGILQKVYRKKYQKFVESIN